MDIWEGVYTHFKGKKYEVYGTSHINSCICNEAEKVVVYKQLYGNHDFWIRPYDLFVGDASINNSYVKRFKFEYHTLPVISNKHIEAKHSETGKVFNVYFGQKNIEVYPIEAISCTKQV